MMVSSCHVSVLFHCCSWTRSFAFIITAGRVAGCPSPHYSYDYFDSGQCTSSISDICAKYGFQFVLSLL